MKKRNIIMLCCGVVLIISFAIYIFCFIDMEDKYANFEKFNVNEYPNVKYSIDNGNDIDTYAIAHISTDYEKYETEGLLYRVSDSEYILLDEIDAGISDLNPQSNVLYKDMNNRQNKLYIHRSTWPYVIEYTLNKENTTHKDLMFDVKKITNADVNMLYITEIMKLRDDKIYLEAGISGYNNVNGEQQGVFEKRDINLKCSLKDYTCEENNESK